MEKYQELYDVFDSLLLKCDDLKEKFDIETIFVSFVKDDKIFAGVNSKYGSLHGVRLLIESLASYNENEHLFEYLVKMTNNNQEFIAIVLKLIEIAKKNLKTIKGEF